jgi:hypothetical protein
MDMTVEFQFTLHEVPPHFTVQPLILPEGEDIQYALLDKKGELYDAKGFRKLLEKSSFARSPDFTFYMTVSGKRGYIKVPLPEWPVSTGYMIRLFKTMGTVKL